MECIEPDRIDYVAFFLDHRQLVERNGMGAFGLPTDADARQWRGIYRQGQREWLESQL